jgi:hypothetical protein
MALTTNFDGFDSGRSTSTVGARANRTSSRSVEAIIGGAVGFVWALRRGFYSFLCVLIVFISVCVYLLWLFLWTCCGFVSNFKDLDGFFP